MNINTVIEQYTNTQYQDVSGFDVNGQNLLAINLLAQTQVKINVHGDLMEIGLFHGRTAVLLGLLRNEDENFIGIDAFGHSGEIQHEDRQLDLDYYGDGTLIKESFQRNWDKYVSAVHPNQSNPILLEKDSRQVTPQDLKSLTKGVRYFSLDGGHSEKSTFHDLELAESVVVDGGILVVDDYFLEDCPAVSVGTLRYFLSRESKFVPFLVFCGRLFFTTAAYKKIYQEAIFSGNIHRWVRFGEFLSQPIVCLIDRLHRDENAFHADVAEWRRCEKNYQNEK